MIQTFAAGTSRSFNSLNLQAFRRNKLFHMMKDRYCTAKALQTNADFILAPPDWQFPFQLDVPAIEANVEAPL